MVRLRIDTSSLGGKLKRARIVPPLAVLSGTGSSGLGGSFVSKCLDVCFSISCSFGLVCHASLAPDLAIPHTAGGPFQASPFKRSYPCIGIKMTDGDSSLILYLGGGA